MASAFILFALLIIANAYLFNRSRRKARDFKDGNESER